MTGGDEDRRAIDAARRKLGADLLVLGHYYQAADNLAVADVVGDSYQLSVAASRSTARFIVFCGVRFMAESARILCRPEQRIFLPDSLAGCPMAEMIDASGFRGAMEGLREAWNESPVPVLYVNSTAEVKAVAGEAGGVCCTSSNAAVIVRRLLEQGRRVFFAPDENLGRNVARQLGAEVESWPPIGGRQALTEARVAVWRGYCYVHHAMRADDVERARARFPGCRVLVHPECTPEVVGLSDGSGSTAWLLKQAEAAPAGGTLVIGTEATFVSWIARRRPDLTVVPLRESRCSGMARITPARLRAMVERLAAATGASMDGEILVAAAVTAGARAALDAMFQATEGA